MDASDFRAEFPVLERVAYLNTGTDGPVPRRAYEAAEKQLRHELEEGRTGRPHFERLMAMAADLRERLGQALGCDAADVGLTRSTTDGVSTVLSAIQLGRGDEVLTSDVEHPGVLAPLESARRRNGFDVRFVPFDELANEVGPRTKLVACSHVSWVDGRVATSSRSLRPARSCCSTARRASARCRSTCASSAASSSRRRGRSGCAARTAAARST